MDRELVVSLAKEIVNQGLLTNWVFYVLVGLATFLTALAASYLAGYAQTRGKALATKADFDELLEQVKKTTRETEDIKRTIGHEDWALKEYKVLRRTKLEELLLAALQCEDYLMQHRQHELFDGPNPNIPPPAEKMKLLAALYFPELDAQAARLFDACLAYQQWVLAAAGRLRPLKGRHDEYSKEWDQTMQTYKEVYRPVVQEINAIRTAAAAVMQTLIAPPVPGE